LHLPLQQVRHLAHNWGIFFLCEKYFLETLSKKDLGIEGWIFLTAVTSLVRKLTKMDLNIFFADGNLGNTVQLSRETLYAVQDTGP
jgi:hypothetical protein